ncbi:MAG: drug efflux transport system ATP-binding protein [Cyanobacteriota bacterium erpe_2018_sw_21hr_WHONDRS-SW48-000092_B_bin.40]|jgi:ABC-2 type transport system ATP-binding protein|nr:drug efflux transport system ATP-binding protein [Cyanobacteriota bacterium erpe_2018_sw_21hr_WHONDRS-SW48-000092_B_bin.40]
MIETLTKSGISAIQPIVKVQGLKKSYGALEAVKGLDFDIYEGEIFGLIGPDGAGKTTTFHVLGGVMEQTAGSASVIGQKPRDVRLEIGYLTQQFSLYLDLSVAENLRYVAGLREVEKDDFAERSQKYLKLMNIERFSSRLAGQLSGGMKQKLALCCALIARPKLLLLDEPTTGVDPVSRREFWDLLATVTTEGVTVAVATPYLDEAERCNRLILMHEGEIEEIGTPMELKRNLGLHRLEVRANAIDNLERRLHQVEKDDPSIFSDVQTFGDRLDVLVDDVARASDSVRQAAVLEKTSESLSIEVQEPTLENVFVTKLRAKTGSEIPAAERMFPFVAERSRKAGGSGLHGYVQTASNGTSRSAIFAQGVKKVYGSFHAVKDVNLQIEYGEIYGLLGANGAGKTTTIKILCGLIKPSAGRMELCGQKSNLRSEALRQRLGYMSQKFTLYDDLTIRENLEFYCGVYCVPDSLKRERIKWVLRSSDLAGQEGLLTAKLPGGWKQRLSFGAAVLHQPEVLFLDEPTSGVDPLARREMWKLIRDFSRQGTAVLVTTHFLEEAEYCNNLGFMVAGSLVAEGSPSQIKNSQPGKLVELRFENAQAAYAFLKQRFVSWRVSMFADSLHVVFDDPESELPALVKEMAASGLVPLSSRQIAFSLEDSFISIVQRASGVV